MPSRDFLNQRVAPSRDVLSQELDGETVLLDLTSETYFGLNETGTRVWQLICETDTVEGVFRSLLAEHDIEETTLVEDLHELIKDLSSSGLITLQPRGADKNAD